MLKLCRTIMVYEMGRIRCVAISCYKLLWYFLALLELQESGLLRGTVRLRVGMRVLMLEFLLESGNSKAE